MVIIRFFSLLLLVFSLMLLGADVVSTLERNGDTLIRSFDHMLMVLGVDATPWLQQTFPPRVAEIFIAAIAWPSWAVLGIPGTVLALLTSGPAPKRRLPPPPPAKPPINR